MRDSARDRAAGIISLGKLLALEAAGLRVVEDAEIAHLRALVRQQDEALRWVAEKLLQHRGSCCTFDENNKVVITDESCRCDDLGKRVRRLIADSDARRKVEGT